MSAQMASALINLDCAMVTLTVKMVQMRAETHLTVYAVSMRRKTHCKITEK